MPRSMRSKLSTGHVVIEAILRVYSALSAEPCLSPVPHLLGQRPLVTTAHGEVPFFYFTLSSLLIPQSNPISTLGVNKGAFHANSLLFYSAQLESVSASLSPRILWIPLRATRWEGGCSQVGRYHSEVRSNLVLMESMNASQIGNFSPSPLGGEGKGALNVAILQYFQKLVPTSPRDTKALLKPT